MKEKWLQDIMESFKNTVQHIQHEQDSSGDGLRCKIVDFLADNPKPVDVDIHAFAEGQGIDPHKLEEVIYGMLSEVIEKGKGGNPDAKQLAMGILVEKEHTSCVRLAEYIARAHLKEIPDYYDRLKKMEDSAKK
jgi:hypothetical protein